MIDLAEKLLERLILSRMERVLEEEEKEGISAAEISFDNGLLTHHPLKKIEERAICTANSAHMSGDLGNTSEEVRVSSVGD